MGFSGNTNGTFRPRKLSRAVRSTLLLLLLALALASTVSYAQEGGQGRKDPPAVAAEPPPSPEPEPEPPEITLPPAQPGEELFIANVAVESAEQLAALQQLGYSCDGSELCEIVATEAQLSVLREAGFAVDIVGIMVESSGDVDPLESYRTGGNTTDYTIPDHGTASSVINITGAGPGAHVTRVRYDCLVAATGLFGGPGQYTLEIQPASMSSGYTIWNRLGGDTDQGHDDDSANDRDIYLNDRWVNAHFDGQPVNQAWRLTAEDHTFTIAGAGVIDYWSIRVYYCTTGPGTPTLTSPSHQQHICDTTPKLDWSDVSGADRYHVQVDNTSSFASPDVSMSSASSDYTVSPALGRRLWYWRVRAHNECGYGPWSATKAFYIDDFPAVPVLVAPANGSHTFDTTPFFDWATASGATSYRIQIDDSSSFSSPVRNVNTTSSNYTPTALPLGHYYWRVRSHSACGDSAFTAYRHLYIDASPVNHPPTNGSISPNSGGAPAGTIVYFTTTCSDPDGNGDIKACRFHVGRWAAPKSLIGNAVFVYQAQTNKILIRNNTGTRWWGGKLVGSNNVVQNDQAKVYCNLTTVSRSGLTITVHWAVEFKPAFAGRTKMYLKTRDIHGLTTNLDQKGTWTVQ